MKINSRSRKEANLANKLFLQRLSQVSDGSVYTTQRMQEIFGCKKAVVEEFIRLCRVYPYVEVHRKTMRQAESQFTFHRVKAVEPSERIIELAKEITNDPHASLRSKDAASTIIMLLGGPPCETSPSSSPAE
jgi:hypothetical protein